jgi:glycosidase
MKLNIKLLSLVVIVFAVSCHKASVAPVSTSQTPVTDTLPAQYGTPYSQVPVPKDIIMYEVNIRAFSPQHNLQGVIDRLDSIKALGVNVIWLMPIYPVGQLKAIAPMGSPYSVQNYEAVNPQFGTLDDLRTLVTDAHNKGMAVVLDWVADHTSWDNVWITNKSWYQQDASGNIISPPGQDWTDVAALNYANTDMRQAMIDAMKYWILTANVDGFRCDYADGPPANFWAQAIDSLQTMTPHHQLILLAESENAILFNTGFQMEYAWNYYTALKGAFEDGNQSSSLLSTDSSENSTVPSGDYMLRFTSNHDEDLDDNTPLVLFNGKQGSLAAFVLATYMGGVPLIYDGQEVGDPKQIPIFDTSTIDWSLNPDMEAAYKNLLNFRANNDAIKNGQLTSFSSNDVCAFTKTDDSEKVLVMVNLRDSTVNYIIPDSLVNTLWINGLTADTLQLGTQLSLQPYDYLVLKNE